MQKFISYIQRCLDVCGVEPGLRFFLADKLLEDRGVLEAMKSGDFQLLTFGPSLAHLAPRR